MSNSWIGIIGCSEAQMIAKNPITGDEIKNKTVSDEYRNNFDLIFRSKESTANTKPINN